MRKPQKLFVPASVLAATLILAGCQTTRTVATAEIACTTFSELSYSRQDTDPTVRGIRVHNARYGALCREP